MDSTAIKYLLTYLKSLEDRIEAHRSELKEYADHNEVSVGSITAIASELNALQTEQRAICFTLSHLGFYVVYKDKTHAEKIVFGDKEEVIAQ